jgi:hypothetical protein
MRILVLYRRLFRAMWRASRADQVKPLFALVLLIALLGAAVFRTLEGWSFLDGFYFAIVTMATVGYGDLAPRTAPGKLAAVVFMFSGIGLFVLAISTFAQAFLRELLIAKQNDRQPPPDGGRPAERTTAPHYRIPIQDKEV